MCSTCGKTFSNARVLKSHMNIHTGQRPYTCDLCIRSFTHYTALVTHRKIHTNTQSNNENYNK